ncbi:Hypothetical predicted protein [Mytilus galloprovincialis]|uniref:C1q domain-containing protein n=1 Tax=Mytilus galloprovincialis TaxID=29158 RepID=A0A8B6FR28_MYTGA|nr:Hypothetical predicted protein [Mytilus galloprovincialis]
MENQLDMLTHELNASLTNVFSKMKMLSSQIGENSKKVALTSCTVADKNIKEAITFPNIYTSVGINNQTAFQTTGKFVCDVPGLYYISSYIRTSENGFEYYLMKNDVLISKSATTTWPGQTSYSTSVITAAVVVQRNDELYIRTHNSYRKEKREVYYDRFEAVSKLSHWDNNTKLAELLPRLQGEAGDFAFDQLGPQKTLSSYTRLTRDTQ